MTRNRFGLANYDENDANKCMKIVVFGGEMITDRGPITLILPENMHKWKALDLKFYGGRRTRALQTPACHDRE